MLTAKTQTTPRHVHQRRWLLLALMIVIGLPCGVLALSRSATHEALRLRELRIDVQRLEREDARLTAPAASDVLLALQENGDALRIRLLDTVAMIAESPRADAVQYTIEEHARPDTRASTLRLHLDVELTDGAALLDTVRHLSQAATPWPSEVRGCNVQRLLSERLAVNCALDVLHWADLNAPFEPL